MEARHVLIAAVATLALVGAAQPALAHHTGRIDDRIVQPYGTPVVTHVPILAGYEPVPAPRHCQPGQALSTVAYQEGFEGDHGYTFPSTPLADPAPNLWQVTDWAGEGQDTGHDAPARLYFGDTEDSNYDENAHVAGVAQSPSIQVPDTEAPVHLTFETKWEVEWLKGYDHLWVEAETPDGRTHLLCTANAYDRADGTSSGDSHGVGSCSPFHFTPCPARAGVDMTWETRSVPLPDAWKGDSIRLRFTFDSSDDVANQFMGWMVDDVRIGTA